MIVLIFYHLQFPKDAKEGKVFFHFIVDTTGKITHIEILKSPSEANSTEVLRVMNLISKDHYWTPATQRGKKAKVRMAMPVVFRRNRKNK
ncbi:energy transducer TonB [Bernardetia sp.]|uniref:energy transducer TonB n=1 Tax=Bernardetia sp. TaxID=1937974 RepID=UPI0025BF0D8B|nr:energy transducer TonB [Bernardetia sp.]